MTAASDLALGARGRRCRRSYRTITSSATRSTITRGVSGTTERMQMQLQRSSRLAVCRDRGGPWPLLRHRCHRLDDVHLQRHPRAGLIHHDPRHHRGLTGRRARARRWPSPALAAQPGPTATGGVIAEPAWHERGHGLDRPCRARPVDGPWSRGTGAPEASATGRDRNPRCS